MSSTITLDRSSFKALASDTRISILKLLLQRKHTLTEISSSLNLTHPSVKDHMNALVHAGLVERFDEGRKWKYYGLTSKGRGVLQPERRTILVLLTTTLFSATVVIAKLFSRISFGGSSYASQMLESSKATSSEMPLRALDSGVDTLRETMTDSVVSNQSSAISSQLPVVSMWSDPVLIFFFVLLLTSVFFLLWYWWKSRR